MMGEIERKLTDFAASKLRLFRKIIYFIGIVLDKMQQANSVKKMFI